MKSKKTRSRDKQRNKILNHAGRLFGKNGFEKTCMKEIAHKSGFEPGNIYCYFPNKEQILYEVMKDEAEDLLSLLKPFSEHESGNPVERLWSFIKEHFDFMVGSRRSTFLLYDTGLINLSAKHRISIISLRDSYDQMLRKILLDGMKNGYFIKMDEKLVGFNIASVLLRIRLWFSPKGRFSSEKVGLLIAEFILRSIQNK